MKFLSESGEKDGIFFWVFLDRASRQNFELLFVKIGLQNFLKLGPTISTLFDRWCLNCFKVRVFFLFFLFSTYYVTRQCSDPLRLGGFPSGNRRKMGGKCQQPVHTVLRKLSPPGICSCASCSRCLFRYFFH